MQPDLFESAFKFSSIGAALASAEGDWVRVNPSFIKMLGYSEEEFLQMNWATVTHPEDLAADLHEGMKLVRGEISSFQLEKRFIHKSGCVVYVLISVTVIRNEDGSIRSFLNQMQDISELKETQLKLQSNAKLMALGEMASGIAHEINNPLTIIDLHCMALDMLVKEPEIDRIMLQSFTTKIRETVKRINCIVSSMRKYSSSNKVLNNFVFCQMDHILNDALGMCQEKFKASGVELTVSLPEGLEIECNPVDVSQVLINLLNNAFYAIKDYEEKCINITVKKIQDHLVLSVMDSGPGIPQEIRSKLLEPFFTTKPMGEGTGLGLSISRSIVQSHRGDLYLDASSEKTNFILKLPLVQNKYESCA